MNKPRRQICANCKHASERFKAFNMTHHHCEHPDPEVSGNPGGWATLREFYNTCDYWEAKKQIEAGKE